MKNDEELKLPLSDHFISKIQQKYPELANDILSKVSEAVLSAMPKKKTPLQEEMIKDDIEIHSADPLEKTLLSMKSEILDQPAVPADKDSGSLNIILIEDDPDYSLLIQWILAKSKQTLFQFKVKAFDVLEDGLNVIHPVSTDLILLDLTLPDSQGIDTFLKVYGQVPEIPIVVLTSLNDDHLALEAVKKGAQDYLIKGELNSNILLKAIQYAVERHRIHLSLKAQALTDPLTRLYNRRGFLALAEQQYKLSRRAQSEFLIVFGDLDGLKHINDQYGHAEGDYAILKAAEILKKTFRESDIIARIGGDEFIILHVDANEDNVEAISLRLQENLKEFNQENMRPYTLSLSFGVTPFDPSGKTSLEDVLKEADEKLYHQKMEKRKSASSPSRSSLPFL